MTAEQLEAARSERMRQNGHGAVTIEDVRTWIEETGLCIFLPRSAQAGYTAPTFVEAVAGERTTEPTLDLIRESESLLVRLEAEGIAVRLSLSGQPGDQPDYVVAGWVLPYIYALRGDRDWRRTPQLTGSRQVSPLAVSVAKQLESGNQTAIQLRDALGRETSETAVLRALHELWKQLRVIPVVPEVGKPALWQPLRQRFQKAIAEGASTSQVTAISVLASIYLQAVIAAGMEDIELFLAPLTSRSKIREVVRGLAATRQVHSTSLGHGPLYYVAGTLPEFPAVPSYQAQQYGRGTSYRSSCAEEYLDAGSDSASRGSSYASAYLSGSMSVSNGHSDRSYDTSRNSSLDTPLSMPIAEDEDDLILPDAPLVEASPAHKHSLHASAEKPSTPAPVGKAAAHRPRPGKTAASAHPRERSRSATSDDRHRAPAPRSTARPAASNGRSANSNGHSNGNGSKNGQSSNGAARNGNGNGNGHKAASHNGSARTGASHNGTHKTAKPAWGKSASSSGNKPAAGRSNGRPEARSEARPASRNGAAKPANGGLRNGAKAGKPASAASSANRPGAKPAARPAAGAKHKPASASASKRYSFAGQAKQAPKAAAGAKHRSAAGKPQAGKSNGARPTAQKRRG